VAWKLFDRKDAPKAKPPAEPPPPQGGPSPGCLVCGAGLAAVNAAPAGPAPCALCGASGAVAERCTAGHAVCEACLAGPGAAVVERTCAASEEHDPVALALRLLRHPRLSLGPGDHDLLVPAVLVAAWSNVRGEGAARAARVRQARVRSEPPVPSGRALARGQGAAAGAGTFVAVVAVAAGGAADGALVDRMVARARFIIGEGDDTLCVRRNALVAVLAAARFARDGLGAELPARGLACERAGKNPSCVGAGCPFNR